MVSGQQTSTCCYVGTNASLTNMTSKRAMFPHQTNPVILNEASWQAVIYLSEKHQLLHAEGLKALEKGVVQAHHNMVCRVQKRTDRNPAAQQRWRNCRRRNIWWSSEGGGEQVCRSYTHRMVWAPEPQRQRAAGWDRTARRCSSCWDVPPGPRNLHLRLTHFALNMRGDKAVTQAAHLTFKKCHVFTF